MDCLGSQGPVVPSNDHEVRMREGLPSLTAIIVASARTLASRTTGSVVNPHDELAKHLLPRLAAGTVDIIERADRLSTLVSSAVVRASFGLIDHLALRACVIDAALVEARDRGIGQFVILGAGLDTRAHRLPALRGAHVFEVDHPESQAHKRKRARDLDKLADTLIYVPVDFGRDRLSDSLAAHGHDATRTTFWIWEGVVPYLSSDAIRATLKAISERSALGSELAVTYAPDSLFWFRVARPIVEAGMHAIGEPVHTLLAPAQMQALLADAAFVLRTDTGTRDWALRFGSGAHKRRVMTYEHLALAERR